MGMTLSDAWDRELPKNEALEVYADYVQAVAREFEAKRSRPPVDDELLERLKERREELERRREEL